MPPSWGKVGADLALMTGNVAQVFLEDAARESALRSLHTALRPGGRLAFDSRNPTAREWERWTRENTYQELQTPHGLVKTWLEVVAVEGGLVCIEGHNVFVQQGEHVVAPSTLRFRSAEELSESLARAGFAVEHMYGDWRRGPLRPESLSIVTIARRDG